MQGQKEPIQHVQENLIQILDDQEFPDNRIVIDTNPEDSTKKLKRLLGKKRSAEMTDENMVQNKENE